MGAETNLGPTCGPDNMDLCKDQEKQLIDKFMAMSEDRLDGKIKGAEKIFEEDVPVMEFVNQGEKTRTILKKYLDMSEDRLSGKIRNAKRVVEEEVPMMKKVLAHLKGGK